jgi:hypothetical protein
MWPTVEKIWIPLFWSVTAVLNLATTCWSLKPTGKWSSMPYADLVMCCRKLNNVNIFWLCSCWFDICDFENLLSPADTPQSQPHLSSTWAKVSSQKSVNHLVPQAIQKWELFRIFMSKKWRAFVFHQFYHQWTAESWSLLQPSVLYIRKCLEIHVEVVWSLSECQSLL